MNVLRLLIIFSFFANIIIAQDSLKKTGGASYYAKKFEGRITANGEKFSNYDMTCAHKKLPFNTLLKVTNIKSGISTVVRVNDRGPYRKGRIIDLSEQAARIIGTYMHGITKVEIEKLEPVKFLADADSVLNNRLVIDASGNPATIKGTALSLWRTIDLEHAILLAKMIAESENIQHIYIAQKSTGKTKKYHLVLSNIESPFEAKKIKDNWERKGFMRVTYFE